MAGVAEHKQCAAPNSASTTTRTEPKPVGVARRRGGKRGGRGRPLTELAAVKHRLIDLADAVLEGRQDRGCAAVAGQLLNTAIRALEVERKWHETDELEAHIAELEGYAQGRSGRGQPWRA